MGKLLTDTGCTVVVVAIIAALAYIEWHIVNILFK